jgi:hypothetical protein
LIPLPRKGTKFGMLFNAVVTNCAIYSKKFLVTQSIH